MKRFNLSYLVVLLLMFFGLSMNAQSYMSSKDAIKAVQNAINQNATKSATFKTQYPNTSGVAVNAVAAHNSLDRAGKAKLLKNSYGIALLQELNAGVPVAVALEKTTDVFTNPSKLKGELDILQEVVLFYKNLLAR